ncbi:unnamed protein product [Amoebophrya sp. A120]|nr:unnamed protein product [Amoebophrya sp. A120]|eukprot:GSA120T00015370001.1
MDTSANPAGTDRKYLHSRDKTTRLQLRRFLLDRKSSGRDIFFVSGFSPVADDLITFATSIVHVETDLGGGVQKDLIASVGGPNRRFVFRYAATEELLRPDDASVDHNPERSAVSVSPLTVSERRQIGQEFHATTSSFLQAYLPDLFRKKHLRRLVGQLEQDLIAAEAQAGRCQTTTAQIGKKRKVDTIGAAQDSLAVPSDFELKRDGSAALRQAGAEDASQAQRIDTTQVWRNSVRVGTMQSSYRDKTIYNSQRKNVVETPDVQILVQEQATEKGHGAAELDFEESEAAAILRTLFRCSDAPSYGFQKLTGVRVPVHFAVLRVLFELDSYAPLLQQFRENVVSPLRVQRSPGFVPDWRPLKKRTVPAFRWFHSLTPFRAYTTAQNNDSMRRQLGGRFTTFDAATTCAPAATRSALELPAATVAVPWGADSYHVELLRRRVLSFAPMVYEHVVRVCVRADLQPGDYLRAARLLWLVQGGSGLHESPDTNYIRAPGGAGPCSSRDRRLQEQVLPPIDGTEYRIVWIAVNAETTTAFCTHAAPETGHKVKSTNGDAGSPWLMCPWETSLRSEIHGQKELAVGSKGELLVPYAIRSAPGPGGNLTETRFFCQPTEKGCGPKNNDEHPNHASLSVGVCSVWNPFLNREMQVACRAAVARTRELQPIARSFEDLQETTSATRFRSTQVRTCALAGPLIAPSSIGTSHTPKHVHSSDGHDSGKVRGVLSPRRGSVVIGSSLEVGPDDQVNAWCLFFLAVFFATLLGLYARLGLSYGSSTDGIEVFGDESATARASTSQPNGSATNYPVRRSCASLGTTSSGRCPSARVRARVTPKPERKHEKFSSAS